MQGLIEDSELQVLSRADPLAPIKGSLGGRQNLRIRLRLVMALVVIPTFVHGLCKSSLNPSFLFSTPRDIEHDLQAARCKGCSIDWITVSSPQMLCNGETRCLSD